MGQAHSLNGTESLLEQNINIPYRSQIRPAGLEYSKCPGHNEKLLATQKPGNFQVFWEKATDANTEMTQILELSEKDFKATIIFMPQEVRMNTLETMGSMEDRRTKWKF